MTITRHRIGSHDPTADPIRLAVLTDLHLKDVTGFHERLASAVSAVRPTCIVFVGDSIDAAKNLHLLSEFLRLLPDGVTRIATLGNWEHWSQVDLGALRRVYDAGATRLLVNESAPIADGVMVYGTDDSIAGAPSLQGLPGMDGDVVVLTHCPEFRDSLGENGTHVAAVISGHTHGGQVNLAGWAPLRPPGSGRYVSGWYRDAGPDLFVSRGLGTSLFPVRLGSVPELAVIEWYPRHR